MPSFNDVTEFEQLIANYFGASYGVATDSCTHAIELSLRHDSVKYTTCPKHTYLSIPMTLMKLGVEWNWNTQKWSSYYFLPGTRIVDGAVLWEESSYIPESLMCLSFQFRKHLPIGRGGMILTDDYDTYQTLKAMSYDGRDLNIPWAEQNVSQMGYHYYMTPESAELGIKKFYKVKDLTPKNWSYRNYPDLSEMEVFNNGS